MVEDSRERYAGVCAGRISVVECPKDGRTIFERPLAFARASSTSQRLDKDVAVGLSELLIWVGVVLRVILVLSYPA